jgi:hypothetical protein
MSSSIIVISVPLKLKYYTASLKKGVVHVGRFFVFYVMFCKSEFILLLLAIEFSFIHRFAASDYPFGIFTPFLCEKGYQFLLHIKHQSCYC